MVTDSSDESEDEEELQTVVYFWQVCIYIQCIYIYIYNMYMYICTCICTCIYVHVLYILYRDKMLVKWDGFSLHQGKLGIIYIIN